MRQPQVTEMIGFTEDWWGDVLDERLVQRMVRAPFKHLETFRQEWPFHRQFRYGARTLHPELEMFELPPLAPGELRPALRRRNRLEGLVLLLYSESVVLSSGLLAPFSLPGLLWEERSKKENRRIVEYGFTNLMRVRPLVERNLAYFTYLDSSPPFDSYLRGDHDRPWILESGLRRRYPDITGEDLSAITRR